MNESEDYLTQARAQYESTQVRLEFAARMQAEYGKWVISTLLFLHTSAVAGLLYKSQALDHRRSLACFAIGVALAVAAGALAWVNFFVAMNVYLKFSDVRMLIDRKYWPTGDGAKTQGRWIRRTMYASLSCAVLSLAFWLGGAFFILAAP